MTSRKKAIELVEKFIDYVNCYDDCDNITYEKALYNAKKCALIAVDEIFKEHYPQDIKRCDYWQEVKQEIEKL